MAGTVVKLKTPIQFGSETIEALTFKPGKARYLRALRAGEAPTMGELFDIAGKMCGQPPPVMDELEPEDIGQVLDIVNDFLTRTLATGEKR